MDREMRKVFAREAPRKDLEEIGLKTPETIWVRQLASQRTGFAIPDVGTTLACKRAHSGLQLIEPLSGALHGDGHSSFADEALASAAPWRFRSREGGGRTCPEPRRWMT